MYPNEGYNLVQYCKVVHILHPGLRNTVMVKCTKLIFYLENGLRFNAGCDIKLDKFATRYIGNKLFSRRLEKWEYITLARLHSKTEFDLALFRPKDKEKFIALYPRMSKKT